MCLFGSCVMTICLVIEGYFYSVVHRAWLYMKLGGLDAQQHIVIESGWGQRVTPLGVQKPMELETTIQPPPPKYY
jgi:hypothetical protein